MTTSTLAETVELVVIERDDPIQWDGHLGFYAEGPTGEVYGRTRAECADRLAEAARVCREHQEKGLDPVMLAVDAEREADARATVGDCRYGGAL